MEETPRVREFPDRSIRAILERPALLVSFVELLEPALAGRIDPATVERLDPTWLDEGLGKRESDLLCHCSFRSGEGAVLWIYCVLEHQSHPDPLLPFRLLFAMTRLWERERREGKLPFSPVVPILLYTGDRPWRHPVGMAGLVGAPAELVGFVPGFRILYLDLKGADPARLAASESPLAAALLAWREEGSQEGAFSQALARAASRVNEMEDEEREDWRVLLRFLFALAVQRRPPEERNGLMAALRSNLDLRRKQDVDDLKGTIAGAWLEEGALGATQRILIAQLTAKFGQLSEGHAAAIRRCTDREKLDRWLARILVAPTLDEMGIEADPRPL